MDNCEEDENENGDEHEVILIDDPNNSYRTSAAGTLDRPQEIIITTAAAPNNTTSTNDTVVTIEELEEEAGLHETTLESLHAKLTKLTAEIQQEELQSASLQNDIQMLNQRKMHWMKRKDNNVHLVKELEQALEKCLERLRRGEDASREFQPDLNAGSSGDLLEGNGRLDLCLDVNAEELVLADTAAHNDAVVDLANLGSSMEEAILIDGSKGDNLPQSDNSACISAVENDKDSEVVVYGEIPLICEEETRGLIAWPSADLVKEIQSEVESLPCHFPAWRTCALSAPLFSNIDSEDLIANIMDVAVLERMMEREERLKFSSDSTEFLPAGCGWVNKADIWGTTLDIYSHVNWRPLFSGFRRIDETRASCDLSRESTDDVNVATKIDPNAVLCPYELGGTCADDQCPYQHFGGGVSSSKSQQSRGNTEVATTATGGMLREGYIRYYNLPNPQLPPPLLSEHGNAGNNDDDDATQNVEKEASSSGLVHNRSRKWKGRSDSEESSETETRGEDHFSPSKKRQKTMELDSSKQKTIESSEKKTASSYAASCPADGSQSSQHVENECKNDQLQTVNTRLFLCPTCANEAFTWDALQEHLAQCNPRTFKVDGNEINVQNVLLRETEDSSNCNDFDEVTPANTEEVNNSADDDSLPREEKLEGSESISQNISGFEDNHDYVSLPSSGDSSDNDSIWGSNVDISDGNECSNDFLFSNEFWWRRFLEFPSSMREKNRHSTFDRLLSEFGFERSIAKKDNSEEMLSLQYIRPSPYLEIKNPDEWEDTILVCRLVDLSRACVHIGRETFALAVLSSFCRSMHGLNKTIIRYASESIRNMPSSQSSYGGFHCQMSLLAISEFCRDRHNWLCGTSGNEPCSDTLSRHISYLINPKQYALKDLSPEGVDHDKMVQSIVARLPTKRAISSKQSNRDNDLWDPFNSSLRLLFDSVLAPFSDKNFTFLMRCFYVGHALVRIVSVSSEEATFSPCLHALDPIWRSVQRLMSVSTRPDKEGFKSSLGPDIFAVVLIGPVIFACLGNTIATPMGFSGTNDLPVKSPNLDFRSLANLSSLDKFIVGVLKELQSFSLHHYERGLMASLLAPVRALTVAIPIALGSFDKAQLRIEHALNAGEIAVHKFGSKRHSDQATGRATPSMNALSEILWSQLVELRMTCPSYAQKPLFNISSVGKEVLLPSKVVECHREIAARIIEYDVFLRSVKLRGDLAVTCVSPVNQTVWQDVATHVFLNHPSKMERNLIKIKSRKKNQNIEVHLSSLCSNHESSVFPESLLLLGKSLSRLHIAKCGLKALPLSIGYHFSSLVVSCYAF